MKNFLIFLFLYFVYSPINAQLTIISNPILCSSQPYKLVKLDGITLLNASIISCNPDYYSEITSAKLINVKGTINNIGARYTGNVHFAIKAPYEDVYVKADRELKNDYIPVLSELRFSYYEEYLDNTPLKYIIYQFKGDNNSYSCNNQNFIVSRGENYITIPLNSLLPGLYILEIEDQKGVFYYVRFKKI